MSTSRTQKGWYYTDMVSSCVIWQTRLTYYVSTEKWPDTPTKLQICDGDNWSPKISPIINPSQDPDDRPKRYVLKFRIIVQSSVAFRLVASVAIFLAQTPEGHVLTGPTFSLLLTQFTDKQSYGSLWYLTVCSAYAYAFSPYLYTTYLTVELHTPEELLSLLYQQYYPRCLC